MVPTYHVDTVQDDGGWHEYEHGWLFAHAPQHTHVEHCIHPDCAYAVLVFEDDHTDPWKTHIKYVHGDDIDAYDA